MKRFISSALALAMVTSVAPVSAMAANNPDAGNLAAAKVVDLGWAKYLTVRSLNGESLENCTLTVDGKDITGAVTPVTTDGSIVKWEVTSNKHAKLVVKNGSESQTIRLRKGKGEAPKAVADQTPDYFLMNGPIYVWDYHLTNYDDEGNVRYAPTQTTIGLDAVSGATAYSRDAIVYEDENALPYFVKGEVSLEFNYKTAEEKAYVDGITDVDLVSANEYKETLNDELHYTLTKDIANGEHVNALITVPIGQVNFTSNGRYNLRVTSNGQAKLFPIHLVAETVPSMEVTGDQGYYGNEVHLRISDMTYGITRPIYRVELTNPDGVTETLLKFDDWFLHGDLLVLYNSITNHFRETGGYTVTVYADGFQTFRHTFWQNAIADRDPDAEAAPVALAAEPVTFDAISTASVGGGSSSGGGSDGGDSKFMNANLIVDSDLIANAKLAIMMGVNDETAQGISDRWDSMNVLYAFDQGAETVYDFDAYYNAVNTSKKYLTFAEYTASKDAVTTPNRPYAVKQVLEDNLLGETTGFIEAVGLMTPGYTVELKDNAAVITFENDADYMAAVAAGQLTLNGSSVGLQAGKDYVLEGNVLTLNNVDYGVNLLSIRTETYETARIEIERIYPVEPVELSANDITKGEEIVVKCTANHETGKCDFMEHITGVQIIAPNGYRDDVLPDGAESVFEEIGYTVSTNLVNSIVIGKDTLLQDCFLNEDGTFAAGEYQIVITAEYYGDKIVTVNVADAEIEGTAAVPTVAGVEYNAPMFGDKFYRVSFLEENAAAYLNAITSITLNGEPAKKVASFWKDTNAYKFSKDEAQGGADQFIDFTADCFADKTVEVVIHAEGYVDMAFTVVNGEFELVLAAAPVVADVVREGSIMGQYDRVSFEGDVADYLAAITSVTLNGEEAMKVTNLFNETNAYKFSNDDAQGGADKFIDFTADCFAGEVVLVIKATGYEDLTLNLVDGKVENPSVTAPAVKAITEAGGFMNKHYTVSFEADEAAAVAYLEAVTAITVDGEPLKKVTSFWGESMGYKISNDPAFGGAYQFLDFTTDCYGMTVVVSAEGYADLTFVLSK